MFDSDIKTDLGKAYLKAYGAYYNLPAALQGETALGEDETRNIKGVCPVCGGHLFFYLKVDAITDSEAYITPLKTFNDFFDGFGKTQCITGVYEYSEVKFVT
jgi:hypothetical protein